MVENAMARWEYDMGIVCDGPQKCTRQATHIVTYHRFDHCTESPTRVMFFCPECTTGICKVIGSKFEQMKRAVAEKNTTLKCETCSLEVKSLADVLTVEHLVPTKAQGAQPC